jgi:hypothetical protein
MTILIIMVSFLDDNASSLLSLFVYDLYPFQTCACLILESIDNLFKIYIYLN